MRGRGFKISPEKRQELVDLYMQEGIKGVAAAAKEAGVSIKYVCNIAASLGLRRGNKATMQRDYQDHRWEWAKKRGAIIL